MFTGWPSSWLGGSSAVTPNVSLERARESVLREYVAEQLRERSPAFFEDDIAHGRRVIDAAIALGDALSTQQKRFSVAISRSHLHLLAESLVEFIITNEGLRQSQAKRQFDDLVRAHVTAARGGEGIEPIAPRSSIMLDGSSSSSSDNDALTTNIIDAWLIVMNDELADIGGVCMVGCSHHDMPRKLYHQWMSQQQSATPTVAAADTDSYQAYDIRYSVFNDEVVGELLRTQVDHKQVARQALAPLIDSVSVLRRACDEKSIRVDFTLNVELTSIKHSARSLDDEHQLDVDAQPPETPLMHKSNVMASCSCAYRAYSLPSQEVIDSDYVVAATIDADGEDVLGAVQYNDDDDDADDDDEEEAVSARK